MNKQYDLKNNKVFASTVRIKTQKQLQEAIQLGLKIKSYPKVGGN